MMGDELVGPLGHPRQITDAEFATVPQGGGDRQARWIAEGLGGTGRYDEGRHSGACPTQRLGLRQVQAQQVAVIRLGTHPHILTNMRMILRFPL
jgi:hypothetical protein